VNRRWQACSWGMAGLALVAAAALTGPGTAQAGTGPNKIASGVGAGRAAPARTGPNRIAADLPSPGKDNELYGVAALSAGDAWAVGNYQTGPSGSLNLIEHWNGRTWKLVHSPDLGGPAGDDTLYSVTAVSARNIWAVGYYDDGDIDHPQPLIEHWNGARWTVAPGPDPGGAAGVTTLFGVTAVSAQNIWAVGYYGQTSGNQTLVEHWNGSVWAVVPSPESGLLTGVAASSRRNAWAVGYYWPEQPTVPNTLVEHWNGATWKVVPSPDRPGPGDPNLLTGAAVTSARNAWAVGYYANAPLGEGAEQTLIEHWNGQAWKIAPSPNPGGSAADNSLYGVTAVSPTDAWAVGYYSRGGDHTIIEHWNGRAWHAVQSPDPAGSSGFNDLNSVAAASASDAWAAGGAISAIALHWNGHAWKG
jgi:hypothetical protein